MNEEKVYVNGKELDVITDLYIIYEYRIRRKENVLKHFFTFL